MPAYNRRDLASLGPVLMGRALLDNLERRARMFGPMPVGLPPLKCQGAPTCTSTLDLGDSMTSAIKAVVEANWSHLPEGELPFPEGDFVLYGTNNRLICPECKAALPAEWFDADR